MRWLRGRALTLALCAVICLAAGGYLIGVRNNLLLEQLAGMSRDPLQAEWLARDGVHYRVIDSEQPGDTDETWQDRFDARVDRNKKKHPPALETR